MASSQTFDQEVRALRPVALTNKRMRAFKRLQPKHLRVVALFLQGKPKTEIAAYMGLSPVAVGTILRNPAVQEMLNQASADYRDEIRALQGPAIEATRDALTDTGEPALRLRAADMAFKLNHAYDEDTSKNLTAEDVVAKLIAKRRERTLHIESDGPVRVTVREEETECEASQSRSSRPSL